MKQEYIVQVLYQGEIIKQLVLPEGKEVIVGRDDSCDIQIADGVISRKHAKIVSKNGEVYLSDLNSSNKTWLDNIELIPYREYVLSPNKQASLASRGYKVCVVLSKTNHADESNILGLLKQKRRLTIGRDNVNDIVLTSLQVSRQHAVLEFKQDQVYVTDLQSTNGTYINGQKIFPNRPFNLQITDRITIGHSELLLLSKSPVEIGKTGDAIIATKVRKEYAGGKVGLHELSFKIPAKSFIALMGPSGCGKSTLLKGLIGVNPFTSGKVYIHGIELNSQNFNQLKRNIGYVPQDDIIHKELTVNDTLYFAAKLRLADDISESELESKITEVLGVLNIGDPKLRKSRVKDLSGGQRKRVSIAVELLNEPTILFLDEPTSPLDPETIGDFLTCIKALTNTGVTVIMVTHKPTDLEYTSQVVFLSSGGYLTYFGNQRDLLPYYNVKSIIDVYSLLKTADNGLNYYRKWIAHNPMPSVTPLPDKLNARSDSYIKQLYWLSRRYLQIKLSDRYNLGLLLAQPVIIAMLIGFIFDSLSLGVLFLMAISAVWFGVSNASKEIVGEIPIYERERMFNLHIGTYLLSKIAVLSLIAFVQCLVFVGIIHVNYAGGEFVELRSYFPFVGTMFYLSVSATLFGLLLSAIFDTTEKVMTMVPIALIPQIMLAGVVSKIDNSFKEILSLFTLGRWGTEVLATLQDDTSKAMENPYHIVNCPGQEPVEKLKSVVELSPQIDSTTCIPNTNVMSDSPNGAIELLGYYGSNAPKTLAVGDTVIHQGYNENIIFISAINVVTLIFIVFMLKTRDKLK